jgi:protein tyrosine phosphatase
MRWLSEQKSNKKKQKNDVSLEEIQLPFIRKRLKTWTFNYKNWIDLAEVSFTTLGNISARHIKKSKSYSAA